MVCYLPNKPVRREGGSAGVYSIIKLTDPIIEHTKPSYKGDGVSKLAHDMNVSQFKENTYTAMVIYLGCGPYAFTHSQQR